MNHVTVDAADAVELIEILEYFIESLDKLGNDATATPFRDCVSYRTDDLRADLTRLVDRLNRSPLTP
jgi:hypothetical protein